MPATTVYNVFHHPVFDWMVPLYFFLSGLACGTYLAIAMIRMREEEDFRKAKNMSAYLAPLILAIALTILVLHLKQPLQFWRVLVHFNPTAVASWAVWIKSSLLVYLVVYAFLRAMNKEALARKSRFIGVPLALAASAYPGLIMMQMKGYAPWNTGIIPLLFSMSAVVSGVALITLCAVMKKSKPSVMQALRKIMLWVILIQVMVVIMALLALVNSTVDAMDTAWLLLTGAYSPLFLGVFLFLGTMVPLYMLAKKQRSFSQEATLSTLVIIGILAMRYAIIMSGQHFPKS